MCGILLSFIVPVYNVEKYLHECLDSIFDRSANDDEFEVIAVDDGSTDNSSEILKTYAHHKNLRIITQKNAGPSVARNTGIQTALGRYIYFIDSDDFLLPGAVPVLLDWARESDSDIIEFEFEMTNETSLTLSLSDFRAKINRIPMSGNGKMVFPRWREDNSFISVVWVRIYKRKLLIDNNLFFHPGIIHEDEEWTYRCFFYAANVIFHPLAIYNYRRRDGSITLENTNGTYRRCKDIFTIVDSLVDFTNKIENNPENAGFLHAMNSVIVGLYRINVNFLSADTGNDIAKKEKFADELAKRKYLLKFAGGSKNRYLYWFLRIFPARIALRFYNIIARF